LIKWLVSDVGDAFSIVPSISTSAKRSSGPLPRDPKHSEGTGHRKLKINELVKSANPEKMSC
jgi:hypothetical protein